MNIFNSIPWWSMLVGATGALVVFAVGLWVGYLIGLGRKSNGRHAQQVGMNVRQTLDVWERAAREEVTAIIKYMECNNYKRIGVPFLDAWLQHIDERSADRRQSVNQ